MNNIDNFINSKVNESKINELKKFLNYTESNFMLAYSSFLTKEQDNLFDEYVKIHFKGTLKSKEEKIIFTLACAYQRWDIVKRYSNVKKNKQLNKILLQGWMSAYFDNIYEVYHILKMIDVSDLKISHKMKLDHLLFDDWHRYELLQREKFLHENQNISEYGIKYLSINDCVKYGFSKHLSQQLKYSKNKEIYVWFNEVLQNMEAFEQIPEIKEEYNETLNILLKYQKIYNFRFYNELKIYDRNDEKKNKSDYIKKAYNKVCTLTKKSAKVFYQFGKTFKEISLDEFNKNSIVKEKNVETDIEFCLFCFQYKDYNNLTEISGIQKKGLDRKSHPLYYNEKFDKKASHYYTENRVSNYNKIAKIEILMNKIILKFELYKIDSWQNYLGKYLSQELLSVYKALSENNKQSKYFNYLTRNFVNHLKLMLNNSDDPILKSVLAFFISKIASVSHVVDHQSLVPFFTTRMKINFLNFLLKSDTFRFSRQENIINEILKDNKVILYFEDIYKRKKKLTDLDKRVILKIYKDRLYNFKHKSALTNYLQDNLIKVDKGNQLNFLLSINIITRQRCNVLWKWFIHLQTSKDKNYFAEKIISKINEKLSLKTNLSLIKYLNKTNNNLIKKPIKLNHIHGFIDEEKSLQDNISKISRNKKIKNLIFYYLDNKNFLNDINLNTLYEISKQFNFEELYPLIKNLYNENLGSSYISLLYFIENYQHKFLLYKKYISNSLKMESKITTSHIDDIERTKKNLLIISKKYNIKIKKMHHLNLEEYHTYILNLYSDYDTEDLDLYPEGCHIDFLDNCNIFISENEKVQLKIPKTKKDLVFFSNEMHNCIYGYHEKVLMQKSDMFNIYKDNQAYMSLEIVNRKINEVKLKYNEIVPKSIENNIYDFLKQAKILD